MVFIGPYDGTVPYNETSLKACNRVLANIDEMRQKVDKNAHDKELEKALHNMIKKVTAMSEELKMNTIVSEIMIFTKLLRERDSIPEPVWRDFIKLLAPTSPFLAEDLWQEINGYQSWDPANSVHLQSWPEFDPKLIKEENTYFPDANIIRVIPDENFNDSIVATLSISESLTQKRINSGFNDTIRVFQNQ